VASESIDHSLNRQYLEAGTSAAGKLSICVVVESRSVPRFIHATLADLSAAPFVSVAAVHVEHGAPAVQILSWSGGHVPTPLAAYHRLFDGRGSRLPDALEVVDASDLLGGIAPLDLAGPAQPANEADRKFDLILCFGSPRIGAQLAALARYGAWMVEYGSAREANLSRALLTDFSGGELLFPVRLISIGPNPDTCEIVTRLTLSTNSRASLADNVSSIVWSMQHIFIQSLHKLHAGQLHKTSCAGERRATHPSHRERRWLDSYRSAKWVARTAAGRMFRRALRGRRGIEWQIAVRRSERGFMSEPDVTPGDFRWLSAERGHFWADPFLFAYEGQTWLFFEDYPYATGRGVLSCGILGDSGELTDTRLVLDRPYHLSYPQVFEWSGHTWMLPETTESGQVELYRCEGFPDRWKLETVLLPLRGTDPTIVRIEGRWWLFISPIPVKGQTATLLLYCADEPTGPWREVAASPASTDVRFAHGAGRIFIHEGQLIRPSQDCAKTYGYSVGFNRIDHISEDRYSETLLRTMLPNGVPSLKRVHTYNRLQDWEAIDGFRYCTNPNL
jgi:hypothetical protein